MSSRRGTLIPDREVGDENLPPARSNYPELSESEMLFLVGFLGIESVPQRVYNPPEDGRLLAWREKVQSELASLDSPDMQARALGRFVSECLGGPVRKDQVFAFAYNLNIAELRCHLQSNCVPLGMLKAGVHLHRALMFKSLEHK
ncbi:unnamed protein product [Protopolystoma xenopodis]|uniref:EDR1/CTR1/ARMC3-like peptidase-like domain-containing protein n=1 Tax=Protopolystoma xenopodis TaxID=117903 RepID=A0A3S5AK24_9PLAT|nr:unnamed protein product [Protopolystoma xenopodis]